jgi:hypothetical protein
MRIPSFLNWILLCANTLLLALLLWGSLFRPEHQRLNLDPRPLPNDIAMLGMDVYYEKNPFVLLVGKDFPRNESFVLAQRGRPLYFSAEDGDTPDGEERKQATVGLGADFSLSCGYSLHGDGADIHHLMLCHRNKGVEEALFDLNADGVFDTHHIRDEKRHVSHVYVLYQGAWREIFGADKDPKQDQYHKQLVDGQRVVFDKNRGCWLSSTGA